MWNPELPEMKVEVVVVALFDMPSEVGRRKRSAPPSPERAKMEFTVGQSMGFCMLVTRNLSPSLTRCEQFVPHLRNEKCKQVQTVCHPNAVFRFQISRSVSTSLCRKMRQDVIKMRPLPALPDTSGAGELLRSPL